MNTLHTPTQMNLKHEFKKATKIPTESLDVMCI